MALFFRIVEQSDGRWACRHGRVEYDRHRELADARRHIRQIATVHAPASIFVHYVDGSSEHLEDV